MASGRGVPVIAAGVLLLAAAAAAQPAGPQPGSVEPGAAGAPTIGAAQSAGRAVTEPADGSPVVSPGPAEVSATGQAVQPVAAPSAAASLPPPPSQPAPGSVAAPEGAPALPGALAPGLPVAPAPVPAPVPARLPGQAPSQMPGQAPAQMPAPAVATAEAPPSAPVTLLHPQVIDSATLAADGRSVKLWGLIAMPDPAGGFQTYLRGEGDQVSCLPHGAAFTCALPDRTDVALVALANGAAQATADAPDEYRQEEASAQAARRGVWAALPPPPVVLDHPQVRNSALLTLAGQSYPLAGLQGLSGRPASELAGYIVAHGDTVRCQQQPDGRDYICALQDGTDLGKAALVNGAARATSDAPPGYAQQEADAAANKRGLWATVSYAPPPPTVAYEGTAVVAPPPDDAPFAFIGGQPTAIIDGEQAFFVFGAGLGWGYWDQWHHWHGAPERYGRYLDRYHPEGRGFRGYDHVERAGFDHRGLEHGGFEHGGFDRGRAVPHEEFGHVAMRGGMPGGVPGPAGARFAGGPGFARPDAGFVRPGAAPGFGRPGVAPAGFGRPGMPAMAGRPGMAPVMRPVAVASRPAPVAAARGHR